MALPSLENLRHVHIIGACGTLMGSFAAFLKRRGIDVTGSDQNVYPPMSDVLQAAGVELVSGYRPENLQLRGRAPDLIVVGNVISASNPEAQATLASGIPYASLPQAMELLMLQKTRNLVVAGTHGKTTTSSILAHVLRSAGKDPSYFIGGVSQDLPFSFNVSSTDAGRYFVLEGDEYDTAFWDKVPKFTHYLPDDVILTSVEFDHADIYKDLVAVVRAFEGLVDRIRPGGRLIACLDFESVKGLLGRVKVPVITYGQKASGARFYPDALRMEEGNTCFEIRDRDQPQTRVPIRLSVAGMHNVLNATAVWLEARELGLSSDAVAQGLASFKGVKRRQEVRGEPGGVLVIDDFAHHPTAVRETLRGLRLKYPGRRIVTVFEPRSATSRRKVFQQEYVEAFKESDLSFVAVPYDTSKIDPNEQFSTEQLVADLTGQGKQALVLDAADGPGQVAKACQRGDLVAVLSNGGFGGFIPKLLGVLQAP